MLEADNLPPSCAVVTNSGNLHFLEPCGPVQACNGTAFTLVLSVFHEECPNVAITIQKWVE